MQSVHNDLICLLYKLLGRVPSKWLKEWKAAGYSEKDICDDVTNYERQQRAAHELAAANSEWMGLAKSPAECRELIAQGKLCAVQAGGEVGDLCKRKETPEECVARLHKNGARMMQLAHLRNNRYAGVAMHTEFVNTAGTVLEILRNAKVTSAQVKSKTGVVKVIALITDAWKRLTKTAKELGSALSKYPFRTEAVDLVGHPKTPIKYNPLVSERVCDRVWVWGPTSSHHPCVFAGFDRCRQAPGGSRHQTQDPD
jgi:hypothetical protein